MKSPPRSLLIRFYSKFFVFNQTFYHLIDKVVAAKQKLVNILFRSAQRLTFGKAKYKLCCYQQRIRLKSNSHEEIGLLGWKK